MRCLGPSHFTVHFRTGRYEVYGYVYSAAEEPKIMMTGKWNQSMSCQPCDQEGEPLPGTELKEVIVSSDCYYFRVIFMLFYAMPVLSKRTPDQLNFILHGDHRFGESLLPRRAISTSIHTLHTK
jgi:hypothetical protein